jgi:hypothetical protein
MKPIKVQVGKKAYSLEIPKDKKEDVIEFLILTATSMAGLLLMIFFLA